MQFCTGFSITISQMRLSPTDRETLTWIFVMQNNGSQPEAHSR